MPVKAVTSRDNPTFRALLALAQDGRERRRLRQTLLDGEHLLEAALQAGCLPRLLAFSQACPSRVSEHWLARCPDVACVALPDKLFAALSPVDTPSGVLAVVDTPLPESASCSQIVLLEQIQEPGNLGAILRVAAAAGVDAVYLSPGCAEAWSPKCLRGGQGAQFSVNIHEGSDLLAVARSFAGPVHAGLLGAEQSLFGLDLRGNTGFAFGNEGAGISPALQAVCQPFTIPMPGGVESLNVATAAAVCLFERVRQSVRP